MVARFTRPAWALGLGLLGLVTTAHAQQGAAPGAKPAAPATAPPATNVGNLRICVVDLDKVDEGYDKSIFLRAQMKNDMIVKQGELQRIVSQMQEISKQLEGLDPNSNDFRTRQNEFTKLKIQLEQERAAAQADISRRDAESLATIYNDITSMSSRVAQAKGFNLVVRASSQAPSASDPNSVLAAMSRSVLYFDPSLDLTQYVIYNLNQQYKSQGGATVPPAAAAPAAASAAGAPTGDRAAVPASATVPRTTAAPGAGAAGVRRDP